MQTVAKIIRAVVMTAGVVFLAILCFFWAELAWIAFRPLPHIPRYGVLYALKDAGPIGSQYLDFDGPDPLDWGWRLTPAGAVVQLSTAAEATDKARRAQATSRVVNQLGLEPDSDSYLVAAVSPTGAALVFQDGTLQLWQHGRSIGAIDWKARGYSWQIFFRHFHEINAQDVATGDGEIATAPASSGGTSDPHGRWVPLVWRPGYRRPEDLNSRIDPSSGWYLDQAVDINASGQILCVARRTDEKGAEDYRQADAHWVILTPISGRNRSGGLAARLLAGQMIAGQQNEASHG